MNDVQALLNEVWQVYFIRCGPFVKIGYSANPKHRMAILQSYNPERAELLLAIPCPHKDAAMRLERHLHRLFADFRVRGEWFTWARPIRRYIRSEQGGG